MDRQTAETVKGARKDCKECNGTGIFESGVCHCGDDMNGYHDNHSPVEMIGECPYCEKGCQLCGFPRHMHRPEALAHHSECTLEQFVGDLVG